MSSPKIPEALHEALFALSLELNPVSGLPYTDKDLATWLREKHQADAAHDAVTRVLRPYRKAAREARLERVRAIASDGLTGHLATHASLMEGLARDARAAKTVAGRVKAAGEFRKGVEMLVRAAALAGDVDVKLQGSPEGLAEFLGRAFSERAPDPMEK